MYSKNKPLLIEEDIFKIIIPLLESAGQATPQVDENEIKIINFCIEPKSREEIQEFTGLKHREHFRKDILKPLIDKGVLKLTIPNKPTSPKQKYYSERTLKK